MTTIQKDDYRFQVDIDKTITYYQSHTLCDCDYCKNFYPQIKETLPKLAEFLSRFGVDVSKPDEIMSMESEDEILYINVDYTVCGNVISMGEYEIDIQDRQFLSLVITDGFVSPNQQTAEYFTISVFNIALPWVLDQPFPTAVPCKATSPLKRIFQKICKPIKKETE